MEQDENVILVYQDEVHFNLNTSVTRKWAPKGSKPKIGSMPGRKHVAYSGYVIPQTGELIVTNPERFNYETVIQSLRDFISAYNVPEHKKICMIIDNAPWHKKAYRLIYDELCEEYQDIRDKLQLIKLPPYSPDLNPIEQCWRITRREVTHNVFFPSIDDLKNSLDSYFLSFRSPNLKFSSLCSFKYKN